MIVTPTKVIRVEQRLPRPNGIFWNLLSDRRLKIVPVLNVIKEIEEKYTILLFKFYFIVIHIFIFKGTVKLLP